MTLSSSLKASSTTSRKAWLPRMRREKRCRSFPARSLVSPWCWRRSSCQRLFIPGITGRLYQQFAITIAISVMLSAFNALTLSPALAGLLLKPKKLTRGPLGKFFGVLQHILGALYRQLCPLVGRPDSQGQRGDGAACSRWRGSMVL